jgi:D-lactate dehydrogenase
MKIAVFSTKSYDRTYLQQYNTGHQLTFFENKLDRQSAILTAGHDAVCVFVNDILDEYVLKIIAELGVKLILFRCAGYNNIALEKARDLGFTLLRVPAYSPYAVAEHAVALVLTLNRKTHKAYNRVREGNFSLERLEGFDLYQKTIGVVGTGKIGEIFIRIMRGFGCRIIAFDPFPNQQLIDEGLTYVSKEELLSESDIISLHCPLTSDTHYFIDESSLQKVKNGMMLINTSRGGLVDTQSVLKALKSGQVGYLGIDVYEQEGDVFFRDWSESIIDDDILLLLMTFPNVLITSHQGFFTNEALTEIAKTTFENIDTYKQGKYIAANTVLKP